MSEIRKQILQIITTPCMGYKEKLELLKTLRDKFYYQDGELSELNPFIETYERLYKEQEEAKKELEQRMKRGPYVIPC